MKFTAGAAVLLEVPTGHAVLWREAGEVQAARLCVGPCEGGSETQKKAKEKCSEKAPSSSAAGWNLHLNKQP